MYAAFRGDTEAVRLLLAAGANPNASTAWGWTPLMSAVDRGHTDAARLLLEAGANSNAADDSGTTVLTRATWQAQGHGGSADLVRLLHAAGGAGASPLV